MAPRRRLPNSDDIARLVEAELARRIAEEETAAQLAAQNRIARRKESIELEFKSEVGELIVAVREQTEESQRLIDRLERVLSSQTFLDLALLSASVREANDNTQRLLDYMIDIQNLSLELLRFVLGHIKVNGEKARLQEAVKNLPPHPATVEDARPEVEHIKNLLRLQHRTLQMLEEQAAKYAGEAPTQTLHGIEEARRRIGELQEQLMELLEEGKE